MIGKSPEMPNGQRRSLRRGYTRQDFRRRTQFRVHIDDRVRQKLEDVRLFIRDSQMLQLRLGMGGGQCHRPVEGNAVMMTVHQIQDFLAR